MGFAVREGLPTIRELTGSVNTATLPGMYGRLVIRNVVEGRGSPVIPKLTGCR
jgi:hypothetical protein